MTTMNLITELDKTLFMVRTFWMEAKNDADRNKWRVRIDQLLDERLNLMKKRDAGEFQGA